MGGWEEKLPHTHLLGVGGQHEQMVGRLWKSPALHGDGAVGQVVMVSGVTLQGKEELEPKCGRGGAAGPICCSLDTA